MTDTDDLQPALRALALIPLLPPRWMTLFPLVNIRADILRARISRTLRSRDPQQVGILWSSLSHLHQLRDQIAEIVRDSCRWPNALFVPDDECAVLFHDDVEMSNVIAIARIAESLHCNADDIIPLTRGSFRHLLDCLYERYGPNG